LHGEFDIDQAAGIVFDVEQAAVVGMAVVHLLAHFLDFGAQFFNVARLLQHVVADLAKRSPTAGSPQQKRARVSAWCSQVQAWCN
jgi:hypothetical protein